MERIRLEIKRQPIHILLGLFLVVMIYHNILTYQILLVSIITALAIASFIKKTRPKKIYRLLELIERKENMDKLPGKGLIAYLIGTLIIFVLFEKDIAMAGIIVLALGDSFSRLIGPFGKIKHPFNNAKFMEGIIAGFLAASLGAALFVAPHEAIAASFFAMLLEGINLRLFRFKVDDNITIPIIAGFVIWLIRFL
jgi:dolichol kinase